MPEVKALHNGADVFTPFNQVVEFNVQLVLAQMLRCSERNKQPSVNPEIVVYEEFIVLANERVLFIDDEQLKLTKKGYDILQCFIENHDLMLTYGQIYNKIGFESLSGNHRLEAGYHSLVAFATGESLCRSRLKLHTNRSMFSVQVV